MSDSDEFSSYDFSEFTCEDLAKIDRDLGTIDPKAGPSIIIDTEFPALTTSPLHAEDFKIRKPELSPFERFRRSHILSVSDLVAPAWCEVQFDYGLRQKRSRKLDKRPSSFLSGEGKQISVEKSVAVKNDQTQKKGQSVHKLLEKEIRPETIHVDIDTDEERWALRLVNMLSCLECLMTLGCAREMPVFGILHNQVVTGIIDELSRKEIEEPNVGKRPRESSQSTPKAKKIRQTPSPSQPQITAFYTPSSKLDPSPSTSVLAPGRPSTPPANIIRTCDVLIHRYTLHLLDTKTRRSYSLPSEDDTISSRLQLMLYHRLLGDLMSRSFNFSFLWHRLDLDPTRSFSEKFLIQARMILGSFGESTTPRCLNDLAHAWTIAVEILDVANIDPTLQLVYRTQPKESKTKRKWYRQVRTSPAGDINQEQEQEDLARALAASLNDIGPDDDVLAKTLEECAQGSSARLSSVGTTDLEDPELIWAIRESLSQMETPSEPNDGQSNVAYPPAVIIAELDDGNETLEESSKIIGTKEFQMNGPLLDAHLTRVLQWWYGARKAEGVRIENSGRCFSCEYYSDCEWREKKAQEAVDKRVKPQQ